MQLLSLTCLARLLTLRSMNVESNNLITQPLPYLDHPLFLKKQKTLAHLKTNTHHVQTNNRSFTFKAASAVTRVRNNNTQTLLVFVFFVAWQLCALFPSSLRGEGEAAASWRNQKRSFSFRHPKRPTTSSVAACTCNLSSLRRNSLVLCFLLACSKRFW